jgi:hypothetical protein
MIRHGDQEGWPVRVPEVMVAAADMMHKKAGPLQGADELAGPDNRKTAQVWSMVTATVSVVMAPRGSGSSGGIGRPAFARLSI